MEKSEEVLNEMELNQLMVVKIDCHEAGLNASTDNTTATIDRKHNLVTDDITGDNSKKEKDIADTGRTRVVIQDNAIDRRAKHDRDTGRFNADADEYVDDDEEDNDDDGLDDWSSSEKLDNQSSISKRLILFFIACILVGVLLVVVVMFNLSEKPELYSNTTYTGNDISVGNIPSGWTEWSNCSTTCGPGVTSRSRTIDHTDDGEELRRTEIEECLLKPCPAVDGGLSLWSGWGTCSVTCGPGKQTRTRYCTDPTPSPGGQPCSGDIHQSRNCSKKACPVDGRFSHWTSWGQCSTTCGTGIQARRRMCVNPPPQNGGRKCTGKALHTRKCMARECPVDGGLSEWSTWSLCETCGNGLRSRVRSCTAPSPKNGGADCDGIRQETGRCGPDFCPDWEPCTVTCGSGTQSRLRACDGPFPADGGSNCTGPHYETQSCNLNECPVHGGLTQWSEWGSCSRSCGAGHMSRARSCSNPVPKHGGQNCLGHALETRDCYIQKCLVLSEELGHWTDWSECTVPCGTGIQIRNRVCTDGTDDCTGHRLESQWCNTHGCPAELRPTAHSSTRHSSSTTAITTATAATVTSTTAATRSPPTPPTTTTTSTTATTTAATTTAIYIDATGTTARKTASTFISSSSATTTKPITDSLTMSANTTQFNTTQGRS